jgi:periplasmic copper chaperone A
MQKDDAMTNVTMRNVFPIVAFLALGACDGGANGLKTEALMVTNVRVALAASPDRPSAIYFTVEGGPVATRLVSVAAPSAQRVEMHETMMENGMVTMKPLMFVDVPKLKNVEFKPGGKHVMAWGINAGAVRVNKFPMEFMFTNGDRILVDAVFEKPGAAAKAGSAGEHEGH